MKENDIRSYALVLKIYFLLLVTVIKRSSWIGCIGSVSVYLTLPKSIMVLTIWGEDCQCQILYANVCLFICSWKFLTVVSDPRSSHHGSSFWKLGQGQACNHLQLVPFWAEGISKLLLQGNPECVETVLNFFLQSCPPWVFYILYLYFTSSSTWFYIIFVIKF